MIIWKKGEGKISCMIAQQEIQNMGFTLEELNQSKEKTEAFLEKVLEQAKNSVGMDIHSGIKEVEAAILPNQSMLLSISCDIDTEDYFEEEENIPNSYIIAFHTLEELIRFAKRVKRQEKITSCLYRHKGEYFLIGDYLPGMEEKKIGGFLMLAEEFGGECRENIKIRDFIAEHGNCLMEKDAMEELAKI